MNSHWIEILGWIGAMLLSFCAIPEVIRSIVRKKCSIGWGTLSMWWIGEALTLIFIIARAPEIQLLVNYGLNLLLVSILIKYRMVTKNDE